MTLEKIKNNLGIVATVVSLLVLIITSTNQFQQIKDTLTEQNKFNARMEQKIDKLEAKVEAINSIDKRVSVLEVRVDIIGSKK